MKSSSQTLVIDQQALLLRTEGNLLISDGWIQKDMRTLFPFLDSIFDDLLRELQRNKTIVFHAIQTKHPFLPGYYDYYFSLEHETVSEGIRWTIVDATDFYQKQQQSQQNRHNRTISTRNTFKK